MQAIQGGKGVAIGDGRVLVIGWDADGESQLVELWDPATGAWHRAASLNKPRHGFALVALDDGRALVAGGLNDMSESYSSAYVFEPTTERWSKVGLMDTARSEPMAAVLLDGRILLAGGRYSTGPDDFGSTAGVALAGFGVGRGLAAHGSVLANADPGPTGRALATAEIFDPRTETWVRTGPMRYARVGGIAGYGGVGGAAVTLGDGRVLAWGSAELRGATGAQATGEIYDPDTGRFTAAPPLPELDRAYFEGSGVPIPDGWVAPAPDEWLLTSLDLETLAGGDALLAVSMLGSVSSADVFWNATVRRWLRFDTDAGAWAELDEPYVELQSAIQQADGSWRVVETTYGRRHADGVVAPLADGSVLVAGGEDTPRDAELLDPDRGTWTSAPRVPARRYGAEAVALTDGSVLLVGTRYVNGKANQVYRFIPAR